MGSRLAGRSADIGGRASAGDEARMRPVSLGSSAATPKKRSERRGASSCGRAGHDRTDARADPDATNEAILTFLASVDRRTQPVASSIPEVAG